MAEKEIRVENPEIDPKEAIWKLHMLLDGKIEGQQEFLQQTMPATLAEEVFPEAILALATTPEMKEALEERKANFLADLKKDTAPKRIYDPIVPAKSSASFAYSFLTTHDTNTEEILGDRVDQSSLFARTETALDVFTQWIMDDTEPDLRRIGNNILFWKSFRESAQAKQQFPETIFAEFDRTLQQKAVTLLEDPLRRRAKEAPYAWRILHAYPDTRIIGRLFKAILTDEHTDEDTPFQELCTLTGVLYFKEGHEGPLPSLPEDGLTPSQTRLLAEWHPGALPDFLNNHFYKKVFQLVTESDTTIARYLLKDIFSDEIDPTKPGVTEQTMFVENAMEQKFMKKGLQNHTEFVKQRIAQETDLDIWWAIPQVIDVLTADPAYIQTLGTTALPNEAAQAKLHEIFAHRQIQGSRESYKLLLETILAARARRPEAIDRLQDILIRFKGAKKDGKRLRETLRLFKAAIQLEEDIHFEDQTTKVAELRGKADYTEKNLPADKDEKKAARTEIRRLRKEADEAEGLQPLTRTLEAIVAKAIIDQLNISEDIAENIQEANERYPQLFDITVGLIRSFDMKNARQSKEAFAEIITHIIQGDFQAWKYTHGYAHEQIGFLNADEQEAWKTNTSLAFTDRTGRKLSIRESDDPIDALMIGINPHTCQAWDNGSYNHTLPAHAMDAHTKTILVENEEKQRQHRIIERVYQSGIMDIETEDSTLFYEPPYPMPEDPSIIDAWAKLACSKANAINGLLIIPYRAIEESPFPEEGPESIIGIFSKEAANHDMELIEDDTYRYVNVPQTANESTYSDSLGGYLEPYGYGFDLQDCFVFKKAA